MTTQRSSQRDYARPLIKPIRQNRSSEGKQVSFCVLWEERLKPLRQLVLLFTVGSLSLAAADQPNATLPSPLTLETAVKYALAHYPQIRAALERRAAANGGIALARTAYFPSANALWQSNRATRNNIFGLLLPQQVIPSLTGPVLPTTSNQSVWGSAAGMLVSWEPVDFGYRRASVDAARAGARVASAEVEITQIDIASATAATFISVIDAQQTIRAAQADVDRREVFSRSVHVLVQNQLRPGADASRSDAELAAARIVLIQARTNERVALVALANLLGVSPDALRLDATPLIDRAPALPEANPNIAANPVASAQNARLQQADAQIHVLDRSYFPHFNLQSSVSARGSGANVDGSIGSGTDGLGLQRENWAVGLTASFPVLDLFSIRARKQIASANERAEKARYQQTVQDISAEVAQAQARLEGAIAIAQATPAELQAARDAETQARARYQAALANVVEVTDAQSLLIRAESDDAASKLNAWRALVGLAAAEGNFTQFLDAVRSISTGGH